MELGELVGTDLKVQDRSDREHAGREGDSGPEIQVGQAVVLEVERLVILAEPLAHAEAGEGAEIEGMRLSQWNGVGDAAFHIRALHLVEVVVERELGSQRNVEADGAIDLPGVGLAVEPRIVVRSVLEVVGIDVADDATGERRLAGGEAHLGVGIELGQVEGREPAALAEVIGRVVVLSDFDVGPASGGDRGVPGGEADPDVRLGHRLVGKGQTAPDVGAEEVQLGSDFGLRPRDAGIPHQQ